MAKSKFLDLVGLSRFKDKIISLFTSHTSDNNIHTSSEEKNEFSKAYTHSTSTHAPTDAEKNIIVGVQKNGSDISVNSSTRKVNITVPTKVSELDNDAGYLTESTANTTYELSKNGSTITLTGSDGSTTSVTDSDTTYSVATTSANGLMSSSDKSKLDGIASGANNYLLPTASSSTLGGVKTTSSVTSTSGLTACPIISGVPYYKDTNTQSSAGSANTSSKIFLVGTMSQATYGTSYSHDTAYVGTDGCLYSNSTRVVNEVISSSEPSGQINGDYWLLSY